MLGQLQNSGAFTARDLATTNRNFNLLGGLSYGAGAQGQIFCVNAELGNDNSGDGTPEKPFASITEALAHAVSGRGDAIVVAPGSYAETLFISKDYITLIGMDVGGYARPDVEAAVAGDNPITVTGQGCVVVHMRFAGESAGATFVQRGNGFLIEDCVIDGDGSQGGIVLLPSDTDDSYTASEGIVRNNYIRGNSVGILFDTGAAPAVGVGSTDNVICGNRFSRNTLDIATGDSGGGVYSVQFTQIGPGNTFEDKNKATYIDLTTTNGGAAGDQSGSIVGNYFASDTITTTKIKMVGTAFTFTGNYYTVGIADGSGLD